MLAIGEAAMPEHGRGVRCAHDAGRARARALNRRQGGACPRPQRGRRPDRALRHPPPRASCHLELRRPSGAGPPRARRLVYRHRAEAPPRGRVTLVAGAASVSARSPCAARRAGLALVRVTGSSSPPLDTSHGRVAFYRLTHTRFRCPGWDAAHVVTAFATTLSR